METRIKYEGYIVHQQKQVEKLKKMENVRLPDDVDYACIYGLTKEVREKLEQSETPLPGSSLQDLRHHTCRTDGHSSPLEENTGSTAQPKKRVLPLLNGGARGRGLEKREWN